jgi:hypothetical protein
MSHLFIWIYSSGRGVKSMKHIGGGGARNRQRAWNLLYSGWLQTVRMGFDRRPRQRILPLASMSRPALRPIQPPIHWVLGGPYLGGKARPRRDADHSSPSSAEVKNEYKLFFLSLLAPVWRVRDSFTLLFLLLLTYLDYVSLYLSDRVSTFDAPRHVCNS